MKTLAVATIIAALSVPAMSADVFRPVAGEPPAIINVASDDHLREYFTDECERLIQEEEVRQNKAREDAANMLDLEGPFRPIEMKKPGTYEQRARSQIPYGVRPFRGSFYQYPMNDGWSPYGNYLPQ